MSQDLVDAARKLLLSYDPLLPDRAFITVLNGDLLALHKALTPDCAIFEHCVFHGLQAVLVIAGYLHRAAPPPLMDCA